MSSLRVVVRSDLAVGFALAGVETHGVEDVEAAEELIAGWLDAGETGLLAIEESLLAHLDRALLKRLDASGTLLYLAIPGGEAAEDGITRSARIARMIRRTIGVRIAFGGEEAEETGD
ncbi:MAG: hypothetical protein HPY64_17280 [Anaerolineae bacterium]|nr:hypothetical protein [Anaerolineae bacterium]